MIMNDQKMDLLGIPNIFRIKHTKKMLIFSNIRLFFSRFNPQFLVNLTKKSECNSMLLSYIQPQSLYLQWFQSIKQSSPN